MVGRPGRYQPRFVAGQIDKLLQANTDEKIYDKAASEMTNARVVPQGGFVVCDGRVKIDRIRNQLAAVALTGGPALPLTASAAGSTVVATFNVGGGALTAVDLDLFAANLPAGPSPGFAQPNPPLSPAIAGTVSVEYFGAGGWTPLDNIVALTDTWRTRRFAVPPGQSIAANQIRVVVNATTAGGVTFHLTGVGAWIETATLSLCRVRPFSITASQAYDLIFTHANIEVYSASGRVASIPTAIQSGQVPVFKAVQSFDTMILTQQSWAPQQIMRQGNDWEWNIQTALFAGTPNYDFGDVVYVNGVAEQALLGFVNFDSQLGTGTPPYPAGGVSFTITVNGQTTPPMQNASTATWGATQAAMQAAINALPGVGSGAVVAAYGTPALNFVQFTVTFAGVNAGKTYAISGTALNKSDAAITSSILTQAVAGGEPLMSSARGWPGCCALFQQRLLLGGFLGAPNAILASQAGNIYNLDTTLTLSTGPMLLVLDTLGNETILDLHIGRTLDIFTSRGEYWMQPGVLATTSTPLIVYSTNNGVAPTVAPIENEGATIYTHPNQGALLEYRFDYAQQNYASTNISVTSSDLVQGVSDNAFRPQVQSVDTGDLYLVKADGDAVLLSLLRSEQIQAYSGVITDGAFLAVGVNGRFETGFAVQRQVNGQPVQFFERLTTGQTLDSAQFVAVSAGAATIAGLSDFVGATVWALVDGYHQGPFVVPASGVIALAFPVLANGTATVGRWTPPVVKTLPVPREIAPGVVSRRPCRVHTVRAYVVETTSIAIGANGSQPFDVPLQFFGGAADTPPMSAPYTGWIACEGIPGFSDDGIVEITQTRPGLLKVTALVVEVDK